MSDASPFCTQQIMDLGEVEVVDSWHEGDLYYEKIVTIPDYEKCAACCQHSSFACLVCCSVTEVGSSWCGPSGTPVCPSLSLPHLKLLHSA